MDDSSKTKRTKKSPRALLAAIRQQYASTTIAKSILRISVQDRHGAVSAMRENKPYLLSDVASHWAIRQVNDEHSPSDRALALPQILESLVHTFGPACKVPVTFCDVSHKYDGGSETEETTLGEYCSYLEKISGANDSSELDDDSGSACDTCRYLKDWHIALAKPRSSIQGALYETPWAFRDDWLNSWHDFVKTRSNDNADDYRFLYAGPKGSWTPMHHDVLLSYSWSVNLIGRKRWLLFPPACTPDLTQSDGSLIADLRPYIPVRGFPSTENKFQDAAQKDAQSALPPPTPAIARLVKQVVVVEQGINEALFVPSGWHHQVENLKSTVSVNHNWFNGFCLKSVVAFALADNDKVRAVLFDLRDNFVDTVHQQDEFESTEYVSECETPARAWARHCEVVLRSNGSLPLSALFSLVRRRIAELEAQYAPYLLLAANESDVPLWPPQEMPSSDSFPGESDDSVMQRSNAAFREWVDDKLALLWDSSNPSEICCADSAQCSDSSIGDQSNIVGNTTGSVGLPILLESIHSAEGFDGVDVLAVRISVHGLYECAAALKKLGSYPAVEHIFVDLAYRKSNPKYDDAGGSSQSLLPWELPWERGEQSSSEASAIGILRALSLADASSKCWLHC